MSEKDARPASRCDARMYSLVSRIISSVFVAQCCMSCSSRTDPSDVAPVAKDLSFDSPAMKVAPQVIFSDNFARQEGDQDPWDFDKRFFSPTAFRNPELSTNPFKLDAHSTDASRKSTSTGEAWWSGYRLDASVRAAPDNPGCVGLGICIGKESGYALVVTPEKGTAVLECMVGQTWKQLASTDVHIRPGTWYRLSLQASGGLVEAFVDGRRILRTPHTAHTRGRASLLISGKMEAQYDDVFVATVQSVRSSFEGADPVKGWEHMAGKWQLGSADGRGGILTFAAVSGGQKTPGGLLLTGVNTWRNCRITALVDVNGKSAGGTSRAGIVFRAMDPRNMYTFGVTADGNCALSRIVDDKQVLLKRVPLPASDRKWHELSVIAEDGFIACSLDGQTVIEAADVKLGSGRVGVFADGPGLAAFDDFHAGAMSREESRLRINPVFRAQSDMKSWAKESSAWKTDNDVRWHSGSFGEEVSIGILGLSEASPVALHMRPSTDAADGYALECEIKDKIWTLSLKRNGQAVAGLNRIITGVSSLTFSKRGEKFVAMVGSQPVLTWSDPEPITTSRVGFNGECREAGVKAPGFHDFTFHASPVDWEVSSGQWGVTQRWACDPRWSFFGGRSRDIAAIWTKESFSGDIKVELWCAPGTHVEDYKSDSSWWLEGSYQYDHPGELNLTLGGDGRDPESGYAFVFNGWDRTGTGLLRSGTVVTKTKEYLFSTNNVYDRKYNHHWFHIVVEKSGSTLLYSVDGRKLLEFNDGDPLPGGRIALWTRNNRLLVGRVRIYSTDTE